MRKILFITVLFASILSMALIAHAAERPLVYTARIDGAIDPAIAVYVHRSIEIAEKDNAEVLVILLETPGGLDDSMRSIVKDFYASKVPIVVYVWPKGARAASAGAIIALASNIAAMSPGTNMGAAHPVSIGGEKPDETMQRKIENDAAAYARSIAKRRGRNIDWAEKVVRDSISATEDEAKKKNVIDIVASDERDLLRQINGRKVKLESGAVTLNTRNAHTEPIQQSLRERFLHVIANPNLAYILMLIAIYGIIFELSNPGSILPGVVGGIALIMALLAFAVLPVNLAGVLLILFGVALIIIDTHVSGIILTVGGVSSFVAGSLILFGTSVPAFRVSLSVVITMTLLTVGFFVFALGAGIRAQKNRVITGKEGMIDEVVEARTDLDPKGKVFAEGSFWNAVVEGEPVRKGELVRIVAVEGLCLKVTKEEK